MECYLTRKRIKIFYLEQHRWILEDIMLKEISHTEKRYILYVDTFSDIFHQYFTVFNLEIIRKF